MATELIHPTPLALRGRGWVGCAGAVLLSMLAAAPAAAQAADDDADEQTTDDDASDADQPAAKPEAPAGGGADAADGIDALRQEYLRLRDRLFRSRARAATVASTLYSSRLRVLLGYESGRYYTVTRSSLRLDGANVYDDSSGAIVGDKQAPRFEGFVAPGRHQISVTVDAAGKDDERFSSTLSSTFSVQVPAGKNVLVTITARDEGDIPYAWKKSEKGTYGLRLDVEVDSFARDKSQGQPGKGSAAARSKKPARRVARSARR